MFCDGTINQPRNNASIATAQIPPFYLAPPLTIAHVPKNSVARGFFIVMRKTLTARQTLLTDPVENPSI